MSRYRRYKAIGATGWKRRLSPHRPSNWLKLSGGVTRRCRFRFPGTSTAGEKRLTAIAPLVPVVTLHYLQNLLEHPPGRGSSSKAPRMRNRWN
ncbi:hypothetical protein ACNKHR_04055 [Shigella flexneri]